ncbi:hypothetical protein AESSP_00078 [Aestuariimicrobium sp. T2.26MG-19.2B]|nr:hypothetical protein AESSP_00078 [Aestuariimicrobium sp. T2.26MG-19.2B]
MLVRPMPARWPTPPARQRPAPRRPARRRPVRHQPALRPVPLLPRLRQPRRPTRRRPPPDRPPTVRTPRDLMLPAPRPRAPVGRHLVRPRAPRRPRASRHPAPVARKRLARVVLVRRRPLPVLGRPPAPLARAVPPPVLQVRRVPGLLVPVPPPAPDRAVLVRVAPVVCPAVRPVLVAREPRVRATTPSLLRRAWERLVGAPRVRPPRVVRARSAVRDAPRAPRRACLVPVAPVGCLAPTRR